MAKYAAPKGYITPDDLTEPQQRELLRRWHAFPQFIPMPFAKKPMAKMIELGLFDQAGNFLMPGVMLAKLLLDTKRRETGCTCGLRRPD